MRWLLHKSVVKRYSCGNSPGPLTVPVKMSIKLNLRRVFADSEQSPSKIFNAFAIEFQSLDRRSANRCQADDFCKITVPGKMLVPILEARVKESRRRSADWINRRDARRLVRVTAQALIGEIFGDGFSVQKTRENMFDGERLGGKIFLTLAILANEIRADGD